ncbi:MAG: helix-hairpin-helix domain-containing protein [Bacteroidota bacterium]
MNSFFWFRKGEFRGIVFIIAISSLVLWFNHHQAKSQDEQALRDFHRLLEEIANNRADSVGFAIAMNSEPKHDSIAIANKKPTAKKKELKPVYSSLGVFDPNSLSDQGWLQRGLPRKNLNTLRNFQKKNGKFYRPEDLLKMYGWDEEWTLLAMKDVEILNEKSTHHQIETIAEPFIETLRLNLNECDSLDLIKIRGIGGYYAGRIISYRNALGGFVQMDQIKEMYGLREEAFQALVENGFVNGEVDCLDVNEGTPDELSAHPYISYKQAKVAVNYRRKNGLFMNEDDLLKCIVFDKSDLRRLKPYLCFNDIRTDQKKGKGCS